jgi:hypothetical protein
MQGTMRVEVNAAEYEGEEVERIHLTASRSRIIEQTDIEVLM